ncbi:MAG: alpha/beta hydrolase fold protein [Bacillota bacterium]|nr:MAG: alpha/beta hydrolase fold protein [Bacillota bacterium]
MIIALQVLLTLLAAITIWFATAGPTLPRETNAIIDEVLSKELPEIIVGDTGYALSDGLNIWYESILPQGDPKGTVLLIMCNGGDALIWPPKFVRALVDAQYHVIRYDHRSTGMSDLVKDWDRNNPYLVTDMSRDAVAMLDATQVKQAHIIGFSLGGMIAQEIAITRPERVLSLTLMMTSGYIGDPNLPSLSSSYFFRSLLQGLPILKYRIMGGEKNLIKERIAKQLTSSGPAELDIREIAELVLYDLRHRRGVSIQGALQHQTAVSASGSRYDGLSQLDVPTLVIHGTADEIIPIEHGQRLAELIPGTRRLWLEGVGHSFPVPNMKALISSILGHLVQ